MSKSDFVNTPRSKERFKHLFAALQDAVVEIEIIDDEPIVQSVNPAFENVFGYTADEICGESLNNFIVPEEYTDEATTLDSRTAEGEYNDRILTRKTASENRQFLYRGVPYEQDGNQYAFAVYSDITDQKQRERELEAKNQQLNEFASILTHDLRNPINIAAGYLDQLKGPENAECVELIENAHDRMQAIIDDTLTLTQEAESVTDPDLVSITELTEDAWAVTETGAAEIEIADSFSLRCNQARTARLFENLFRNAIDHNDDSVTVRVGIHHTMNTTTRTNNDGTNGFYIEDTGSGIPQDQRDQVFEIGKTSARNGTGLGLPIVERIAEAHGWSVQITNGTEGGAKFVFSNAIIT